MLIKNGGVGVWGGGVSEWDQKLISFMVAIVIFIFIHPMLIKVLQ